MCQVHPSLIAMPSEFLLSGPQGPHALFCIADVTAFGALDAARSGPTLQIPSDRSIVVFDDLPFAAWPAYDLTRVRQPIEAKAWRSLALLLNPDDFPPVALRVLGELVSRGSAILPTKHRLESLTS